MGEVADEFGKDEGLREIVGCAKGLEPESRSSSSPPFSRCRGGGGGLRLNCRRSQ